MITETQITEHMENYSYITSDAIIKGIKLINLDSRRRRIINYLIEELEFLRDNEIEMDVKQ